MKHFDLIELCAGTAAVSLVALGAPKFPCSRIGSKFGYADAVLEALGVRPGSATRVLLVERDDRVVRILKALFDAEMRAKLADEIERLADADPRDTWQSAKAGVSAPDDLLWMAGARGGIGGFKGAHIRRASVDGFIPSRLSLVERVRAFDTISCDVNVWQCDVSHLAPATFTSTAVYIDPPYLGRQGYSYDLSEPVEVVAARWAAAGHHVVVSEGRRLKGGEAIEITTRRRGQNRRSLSTDNREWLTTYSPCQQRRGKVA